MRSSYAVVLLASALAPSLTFNAFSQSQKQQEFQTAVDAIGKKGQGCLTIPYSSLSSQCKDQGKNVHHWCDGNDEGPVGCDPPQTVKMIDSIAGESRQIEKLKDQRTKLEDQRVHSSDNDEKNRIAAQIEGVDKQIEASSRQIEDTKRALSNRKDLVDKTMDTINKCISYRQAVMNIFGDALDKVRSEDAPDIKPLAEKLKGAYQDEKGGHEEQIKGKNNALETCRKERP